MYVSQNIYRSNRVRIKVRIFGLNVSLGLFQLLTFINPDYTLTQLQRPGLYSVSVSVFCSGSYRCAGVCVCESALLSCWTNIDEFCTPPFRIGNCTSSLSSTTGPEWIFFWRVLKLWFCIWHMNTFSFAIQCFASKKGNTNVIFSHSHIL